MEITDTAKAHFFNTDGTLATNISPLPTISIYCVDDSMDIVTNKTMTEDGRGFYSYPFPRDLTKHYEVVCDSGLANRFRYSIHSYDAELILTIIAKLTGNNVVKTGNTITIYESDGTTIWRQYDLSNDGRILL